MARGKDNKDKEKDQKREADENVAVADGVNEPGDLWDDSEVEGQLSVDVYQTPDAVVVESTIAGVEGSELDVSVHEDVLTIRGHRRRPVDVTERDYLFQECYWGSFSRSIVLPVEVNGDQVKASLKNGILTVVLPKAPGGKVKVVPVSEE